MPRIPDFTITGDTITGVILDRSSGAERFSSFSVPLAQVQGEPSEETIAAALGIQIGDTIPADLPAPIPDYVGFYQALLVSQTYPAILQASMAAETPALATLIAVFVSAIGEAMNGRANVPALQQAIFLLLQAAGATPEMIGELQALLVQFHLDELYSLVPPQ